MPSQPDRFAIVEVGPGDSTLADVESLFRDLYRDMANHGLSTPLAERGEHTWRESIEPVLKKSVAIFLATTDGRAVGFASGSLRPQPAYLQARRTGFVTHVFVSADMRRSGVGRALVMSLDDWFQKKGVEAIELHVLAANAAAKRFWAEIGYGDELIQMRKSLKR